MKSKDDVFQFLFLREDKINLILNRNEKCLSCFLLASHCYSLKNFHFHDKYFYFHDNFAWTDYEPIMNPCKNNLVITGNCCMLSEKHMIIFQLRIFSRTEICGSFSSFQHPFIIQRVSLQSSHSRWEFQFGNKFSNFLSSREEMWKSFWQFFIRNTQRIKKFIRKSSARKVMMKW